jgi:hypothetical protein
VSLEEMLFRDELRREAAAPGEVDRPLPAIARRVEDARNEANHAETRLEQAYHAILNCALVGLRTNGLRPTDRRGHHIVALESPIDTLGTPRGRVDWFQTLRNLRSKDLYTAEVHATVRQAEEAIREAGALRSELGPWLGERGAGSR